MKSRSLDFIIKFQFNIYLKNKFLKRYYFNKMFLTDKN